MSLTHNENNCHLLPDLSIIGIAYINTDGLITKANKAFAGILQFTEDEITNRPFLNFVSDADTKVTYLAMQHLFSGTLPHYRHERKLVNSQNENVWLNIELLPVFNGDSIQYLACMAQDIHHHKATALEHDKTVEYLLECKSDMEQFAYYISHILRAPLANVLGYLDVIKEEQIETGEVINKVTACLEEMDDRIKDANQIIQGKSNGYFRKEVVTFSALVDEVKQTMPDVLIKNVAIRTSFHEIDNILCVKQRLYSIFYNLISNSIKYKKDNTDTIIEITSQKIGNKCRLTFKDNGIGIDLPNRKKELFKMYKRFHPHSEGKGLGLYIVKTHIEKMRGTVQVNSEVNGGTEFIIELQTLEDIFQTV